MENAFILRGSADKICLKTIRKRFLPVGPLFYCDDVIGVVVSGFDWGSMFGSLKKYKDDGFWKENQYFTVYSETTAYRYRIFSYEDAVNGSDVYKVGYQPGEEYQKFIDQMIKDSDVDTGVKPQTSNKILTLSTCTGNGYSKRFAMLYVWMHRLPTVRS